MINRLNDGDVLKLVPRIDSNGNVKWITEVSCINANIDTGASIPYPTTIYDLENKWARKLTLEGNMTGVKSTYAKRYYANTLTKNGEIKVISFGARIMKIITENPQLLELRSNWHLNIKVELVHQTNIPSFDKSHPVEAGWFCPVDDLNSKEEWLIFLKKNQPDLESYLKERDIYSRKNDLIQIFGSDLISEIISKERNEKLDKLGI